MLIGLIIKREKTKAAIVKASQDMFDKQICPLKARIMLIL